MGKIIFIISSLIFIGIIIYAFPISLFRLTLIPALAVILGVMIYLYVPFGTTIKIVLIIVMIVIGIVFYFYIPIMHNPMPDYYRVQNRSEESDGPNDYSKWVTPQEYFENVGSEG